MKKITISLVILVAMIVSCNNNHDKSDTTPGNNNDSLTTTIGNSNTNSETHNNNEPFSAREILSGYLEIKNALTKDNGKEAAAAGTRLASTLAKIDTTVLAREQIKTYADLQDDMQEHAEHIGANASKIEHQREHFDMLSADMYDMIKAFSAGQTLYQDHCPMYHNNKGANWLSETKDIKNPYLGKQMPTCGTIKEVVK